MQTSSCSSAPAAAATLDYESRARLSAGRSDEAILHMAADAIEGCTPRSDLVIVDVGCGRGDLYHLLEHKCRRYVGIDAVRYDALPSAVEFVAMDLNAPAALGLAHLEADVVVSVETIEHLENPRAFMRLLRGLVRPGGWVVVTTPNQRSLLSLATLLVKGQFSQFQDVHYPAHLTALLDVDLVRIAAELGLEDERIRYSRSGRVVFTATRYPAWIAELLPRWCSDNLLLAARRPR